MFILPYKGGSRSVRALCQATGAKAIKLRNSKFMGSPRKVVLNWGSSAVPDEVSKCRVINEPRYVSRAGCKLRAFQRMFEQGVSIPEYTPDRDEAEQWIEEGAIVVQRKSTRGSGGKDIVLATERGDMINAPLYTRYIKKASEWRVHIFDSKVILIQRKVRNNEIPDDQVDWRIRNHDRGFIFQRNDINPPIQVIDEASKAIAALELDFGAVDVIFNKHLDSAYVLEVNTAPGLEGGTTENYVNAIREML